MKNYELKNITTYTIENMGGKYSPSDAEYSCLDQTSYFDKILESDNTIVGYEIDRTLPLLLNNELDIDIENRPLYRLLYGYLKRKYDSSYVGGYENEAELYEKIFLCNIRKKGIHPYSLYNAFYCLDLREFETKVDIVLNIRGKYLNSIAAIFASDYNYHKNIRSITINTPQWEKTTNLNNVLMAFWSPSPDSSGTIDDLEEINLNNFTTRSCESMSSMFYGLTGLKAINGITFDLRKINSITSYQDMFEYCDSLDLSTITFYNVLEKEADSINNKYPDIKIYNIIKSEEEAIDTDNILNVVI